MADQIELGASIHLPFDEPEFVNLAFSLTAAPRHGERRPDGGFILPEAGGEGFQCLDAAGCGLIKP